jgi:hypothetical protein
MRSLSRLFLAASLASAAAVSPAAARRSPAPDVPPPSDHELAQFVAVEKELVADASRADELCSFKTEESEEAKDDPLLAKAGQKLEASPLFGPVLRRQSISGQRFAQVSVQVAAGVLGLAMADSLDKSAKEQGKPATNRETLISRSPEAKAVAGRQAEISALLEKVAALCGDSDDAGETSDE